jgi:hypothetical protein
VRGRDDRGRRLELERMQRTERASRNVRRRNPMRILQQQMQIPLEGLQWRFLPHFADGEADAAVAGASLRDSWRL